MKRIGIIMLLAAVGVAACSSDDQTDTKEQPKPLTTDGHTGKEEMSRPMTVTVSMNETRTAAVTTTASFDRFSMNYEGSKYDYTRSGTGWSTNEWPSGVGNDVKINFYAYDSGTFNYNSGNPYLHFTVGSEAATQHDLLVSEHKEIAYNDAGGQVSLVFRHACAAVLLNVYVSQTLRNSLSQDLTVNSIVLRNVNNTGDYYFDTDEWTDVSGSADYTLTTSSITVTTTPQQLPCGFLFMIPQSHTSNGTEGPYLDITYTTSAERHATIPLNINWETGTQYTIDIKLTTYTITL